MARRALLDDRFGLALCLAGLAMGRADDPHARADPAMAGCGARTLQDAPFPLWRPAGQFRGARLGVLQARLVAMAAHADRTLCKPDRPVHLCRLQGYRMALVAVRHPVR